LPTAYRSQVLDFTGLAGAPGVYNKATGAGVGLQWQQKVKKGQPAWIFNANYIAGSGVGNNSGGGTSTNTGASSSADGVFNDVSGLNALAQLGYKASNWGAAFGYRYGTQNSAVRVGNGVAGDALAAGQYSNSIAFSAYWQPKKAGVIPSISAGYGYNFVGGNLPNGTATAPANTQSSRSWSVGLQWDDAFVKSNSAGISFGQPANAEGPTSSNPWLAEFFYKIQATDNISITPAVFYGTGINTQTTNAAGNRSYTGWGGVVQTTFRF
jgi:hypothetical protein